MIKLAEMSNSKLKFAWKRPGKATGLSAIGDNNSMRPWYLYCNGNWVGSIHNVSQYWHSKDNSGQWKIVLFAAPDNITFKKRFELDEIEDGKKFAIERYTEIINSDESNEQLFKFKQQLR